MTGIYWILEAVEVHRLALVPICVALNLLMLGSSLPLFARVISFAPIGVVPRHPPTPTDPAYSAERTTPLAFVLLPVGIWPLLTAPVWMAAHATQPLRNLTPLFGTLWSFANGMETSLVVLLYGALGWQMVTRSPLQSLRRTLLLGATLAALSLARLDHALFAASAGLSLLVSDGQRLTRQDRLRAFYALGVWAISLGLYLLYNQVTVGHALPISGAVKTHFPHPTLDNLQRLQMVGQVSMRSLLYLLGRLGSVAFGGCVAIAYLAFALRWSPAPRRICLRGPQAHRAQTRFLVASAIATLGLATYDLLFVVEWHIGEWYAPVPLVFSSLVALQFAQAISRAIRERWPPPHTLFQVARIASALVLASATCALFSLHALPKWGDLYAQFCLRQAPKVVRHYQPHKPKLLSRDDGVIAFATGFPTTSGTYLALDAEALSAQRRGGLQALLHERGISRVTSLYYASARHTRRGQQTSKVQRFAQKILQEKPRQLYQMEFVHGHFGIARAKGSKNPKKEAHSKRNRP